MPFTFHPELMELSETGAAFLVAMQSRAVSHPRFTGQRLDPSRLTAKDLGRLLPVAVRMRDNTSDAPAARDAARQVLSQATLIDPEFSAEDAQAVLKYCPPAELRQNSGADFILMVLAGCHEELHDFSDLIAPHLPKAEKEKGDADRAQGSHGWLLLASLCKTPEAELLAETMRTSCASAPLRCARSALDQGAPWLDAMLSPLWKNTSVAPGPAKTMPSQSVAISLGRAVEEMPNASAISTMREVIRAVRHGGVKKKLSRMLRTAERRLADRPDLILHLPSDAKLTQTMVTAVRRSMEALYRSQPAFALKDWQSRFCNHEEVFSTAKNLIWRITQPCQEPFGAMPVLTCNQLSWPLVDGTTRAADIRKSIVLWHPLVAEASERDVWRVTS